MMQDVVLDDRVIVEVRYKPERALTQHLQTKNLERHDLSRNEV